MRLTRLFFVAAAFLVACVCPAIVGAVTSPKEHFGFSIGDDYQLATYTQTEAYFKKLAAESPRVKLVDMGQTEEGRTQWMLVISDPENMAKLARYQEIARRLARAEDLTDAEAKALAAEGKAVVWIDGGLHASETVGSHQLIETAWTLASAEDAEIKRVLKDVIVLVAHANPDGQELVSTWYLREPNPALRTTSITPRLYQKYIGHDNNRDFFYSAQRESTNINRQLYLEWFPQVVYNHHQTGPVGTVIFVPPFRDPFNYNYDPLVVNGVETLGNAIQKRFLEEGKPRRHFPEWRTLFHLVQRRTPHHELLSQHDRPAHRDHREPHPHSHSAGRKEATPLKRPHLSRRAAGMALPAVDRILPRRQPRGARLRVAQPRRAAV
jgi:hypothetical protein